MATNELGRRMRMAVGYSGLPQKEVAARSGTTPSVLSRYVNGKQDPGLSYIARFVTVTGIDGHWLVTGEGSPHRPTEAQSARMLEGIMDVIATDGDEAARLLEAARHRHTTRAESAVQSAVRSHSRPAKRRRS